MQNKTKGWPRSKPPSRKGKAEKTVQNDAMTLPLIVAQSEHTTLTVSKQSELCVVSISGTLPLRTAPYEILY